MRRPGTTTMGIADTQPVTDGRRINFTSDILTDDEIKAATLAELRRRANGGGNDRHRSTWWQDVLIGIGIVVVMKIAGLFGVFTIAAIYYVCKGRWGKAALCGFGAGVMLGIAFALQPV